MSILKVIPEQKVKKDLIAVKELLRLYDPHYNIIAYVTQSNNFAIFCKHTNRSFWGFAYLSDLLCRAEKNDLKFAGHTMNSSIIAASNQRDVYFFSTVKEFLAFAGDL